MGCLRANGPAREAPSHAAKRYDSTRGASRPSTDPQLKDPGGGTKRMPGIARWRRSVLFQERSVRSPTKAVQGIGEFRIPGEPPRLSRSRRPRPSTTEFGGPWSVRGPREPLVKTYAVVHSLGCPAHCAGQPADGWRFEGWRGGPLAINGVHRPWSMHGLETARAEYLSRVSDWPPRVLAYHTSFGDRPARVSPRKCWWGCGRSR